MEKLKLWFKFQKKDLIERFQSYSKKRFLAVGFLAILFLLGIFRLWLAVEKQTFILLLDQQIGKQIFSVKSPLLDGFFGGITILGTNYFIAGLMVVLTIFLVQNRRKKAAATALFALTGSIILIYFLKGYFARIRPNGEHFSFPSGHASLSVYFYGLLAYLAARFSLLSSPLLKAMIISVGFLVILISFSRIYLGLHYIGDIIGGFLLGGIWLAVAIVLVDFLYK